MSNKNLLLLLPNYYIQSSINYVFNITENIYTASIVEQLRVCRISKSQAGQIVHSIANRLSPLQHLRY